MGNKFCCYEFEETQLKAPSKKRSLKKLDSFVFDIKNISLSSIRRQKDKSLTVTFRCDPRKADCSLLPPIRGKDSKSKSLGKTMEEKKVKEYFKKLTSKKTKRNFKKTVTIRQTIEMNKEIALLKDS